MNTKSYPRRRLAPRVLLIALSLTLGGTGLGCGDDLVPSLSPGSREPVFEPARPPRAPMVEGFALGPIEGLTSGWHAMPDVEVVPILGGGDVDLRYSFSDGVRVQWRGATEVRREKNMSYARCPTHVPGRVTVTVTSTDPRDGSFRAESCVLEVVDAAVADLVVTDVRLAAAALPEDEGLTNEETTEIFFGHSVASVVTVGDDHYRTSLDRELDLLAYASDPRLAPLVEWRVDGVPYRLGTNPRLALAIPGAHSIEAGPPGRAREIRVDLYDVEITSHRQDLDVVPTGLPVTFTAVTHPPGLESGITWMASTKYGTALPVWGRGASFTATFEDTWGVDEDGSQFQWLGVKADHAFLNQDQKPTEQLYWSTGATIRRALINGAEQIVLIETGTASKPPKQLALDLTNGKIYWTQDGWPRRIRRANLDGTGSEDLVSSNNYMQGIALDVPSGKMYWGDSSANDLKRADLNGDDVESFFDTVTDPIQVALDLSAGKIYWTDDGTKQIRRANLDGSLPEVVLTAGNGVYAIAVDVAGGKVYWSDLWDDSLRRANLDGTGIEVIVGVDAATNALALDPLGGKIYWGANGRIQRADLDGSNVEDMIPGVTNIGIAVRP